MTNKKIISVTTAGILTSSLIISPYADLAKAETVITAYDDPVVDWTNVNFTPYAQKDGSIILDPANEPGISPDDVDFTSGYAKGSGDKPSFYVASDGSTLFFRMRLLGDPNDRKGGFLSSVWLVDIAVNGVHKATVGVNGKSPHEDYIYVSNATGTKIKYINKTDGSGSKVPGTRIVDAENGQYFLDFQVPIHRITEVAPDITPNSVVQFFFGTSKAANLSVINKDYMGPNTGVTFQNAASIKLSDSSSTYFPTISFSELNYVSQTPFITGSTTNAQNGSAVTLELVDSSNNKTTYNTTVNNNAWSVTTSTLSLGTYTATATVINELGNIAQVKKEMTIGKELTIDGPSVIKTKSFPTTITGKFLNSDGKNKQVNVTIKNPSNGTTSFNNITPTNNIWTVSNITGMTQTGAYTVTAVEKNGSLTATQTIIVDNQTSVAVVSPANNTSSSNATPTITGTADANAKVEVYIDGTKFREVTADQAGNWTCYVGYLLNPGNHTFSATATDEFGNTATSTSVKYTVNSINMSIANGLEVEVNDDKPTIRGRTTGSNGSNVTVQMSDGTSNFSLETTVASGRWEVTVPSGHALDDNHTYTVQASVVDKNDPILTASATQKITVDLGTFVTISSPINNSVTLDRREPITGTAEKNATIDINMDNGSMVRTAFADGNGNWQFTPDTDLAYGPHSVVATTSDIVGNTATITTNFIVNMVGNHLPIVQDIQATTQLNTAVSGTLEATDPDEGDTLSFLIGINPTNGTATVDSDGKWTYTPNNNYSGTDSFVIQVSDGKGGAFSTVTINVNAAPIASVATISGTTQVGYDLTGDYTYSDTDNDNEGLSTYQWYRGDNADGTGKVAIEGATSKIYTLTSDDLGKYIFFGVTPVASAGSSPGTETLSAASSQITANNAPTATAAITGTAQVGAPITGTHTFSDVDGDTEGSTTYRWLISDTVNGEFTAIEGATGTSYTPVAEDAGKFVKFEVTPVDNHGLSGVPVTSDPTAEVNGAPTATAAITGTAQVGVALTGTHTFTDPNPTDTDQSTYRWLISYTVDGSYTAIEGATGTSYTPVAGDAGKSLKFEVTPVDNYGLAGTPVTSAPTFGVKAANQAPTAIPSISGTAEVGRVLTGTHTYSDADEDAEGTSTYQWYRGSNADGTGKVAIEGANSTTYTLTADDEGQYIFFGVTPVASIGVTTGIEVFSAPTAAVKPANQAPTALASISGTAEVGKVLNGTHTYSDGDEDTEGVSTYQWYRGSNINGSDKQAIPNATSTTYTLTSDDEGQYIFFGVTPVASTGVTTGTEVFSESTAAVKPANQAPTAVASITGTAEVGKVLTGTHTYSDADKDAEGTTTYQWYRGSNSTGTEKVAIEGANSTTYTLTSDDEGKYIFFGVTPVASTGVMTGTEVFSAPTAAVKPANQAPTAVASISGTAEVGQVLTGTHTYSDADEDVEGTSVYQWYRGTNPDGIGKVVIEGANSTTYTLTSEDQGKYIFFGVTPTASTGVTTGTEVFSNPTAAVKPANQAPTAEPSISGTAEVGQVLTGSHTYSDADEDAEGVSTYQWYRGSDSTGTEKVAIEGANSTTYTLTADDEGQYIFFGVTPVASTGVMTGTEVFSAPTAAVKLANQAPTAVASISGTAEIGQVLTGSHTFSDADEDTEGVSTYQWYRGSNSDGSDKQPIANATSTTYTLTFDDQGKYIFFGVTPVASIGVTTGTEVFSNPTAAVKPVNQAPTAVASISGTAEVGQLLTGTHSYSDADEDAEGGSTYQWYRGSNSNGSDKHPIANATSTTYTLTSDDQGKYIFFGVTPIASTGVTTGTEVFSNPTAAVKPANQAPTAVASISGTAEVGQVLTGTHTYSDADEDVEGTSVYQWYRGNDSTGTVKVAIEGANSTTYSLTSEDHGKYIFFGVTPIASTGVTAGTEVFSTPTAAVKAANQAPTAVASISGMAEVGQVLTGTHTYSDADEDVEGTSVYQWYRGNDSTGTGKVAIEGANSTTYTLTTADQGKYIFFGVTPVASTGVTTGTEVFSAPTAAVKPANQAPTAVASITGTAEVGQVLTGTHTYSDVDQDVEGTPVYQWYRGSNSDGSDKQPIANATSTTYTLTSDDQGKYIFFGVTPVASTGVTTGTEVFSAPTAAVKPANQAPTAVASITGTAEVGQVLTGTHTYRDVDEDAQGASTYQWYRGSKTDGTDKVAIMGATSVTYTLTKADIGQYIFLGVTPVASAGVLTGAEVYSDPTAEVNGAPTATAAITGIAQVGVALTGTHTFTDPNPTDTDQSTYRWLISDTEDGDYTAITGATESTYTPVVGDAGEFLKFEVTPVDNHGLAGTPVTSAPTAAVKAANQAPTAIPSISGTAEVGEVLTGTHTYSDADEDAEGVSIYQWYRGSNSNGSDKQPIANATSTTYTLTSDDEGQYIFFGVTPVASTGVATGTEVFSAPTAAVKPANQAPTAVPSISGTAEVGQVLTGTHTYSDADEDAEGNSVYQWYRGINPDGTGKVAIEGANSTTYTLTSEDQGKYIFFGVTPVASTGVTTGTEVFSAPTAAVKPANQAPTAVASISGTAEVGKVLTGTHTYSDADEDAEGTSTYQWYRGTNPDGTGKVAIEGANSPTYTLTSDDQGKYIFFGVTPVASTGVTTGTEMFSTPTAAVKPANQAPTAVASITGTAEVGKVLTGTHTYSDADKDAEGASVYRWYRGSNSNGSDKQPIADATSTTYTLTSEDQGKYIFFGVTPVASTGVTTGTEVFSAPTAAVKPANQAPTAVASITGTAEVGQVLTGTHTYSDADEDAQGASTYQWYRGSKTDGTDKVAITGATSVTYTLTTEDIGQYIFLGVTPVASAGVLTGAEVYSDPTAEVNGAPTATAAITGIAQVGVALTGTHTFMDPNPADTDQSTYRWLISDTVDGVYTAIEGATGSTYIPVASDAGKYLKFEVTPVDNYGLAGTLVTSAPTAAVKPANQAPTTIPSIAGTAEVGQVLTGSHSYSDVDGDAQGDSTYQWYRGTNSSGSDKQEIPNATSTTYTLTLDDLGKYIFLGVTPVASAGASPGSEVISSARGPVSAAPVENRVPTASGVTISGTTQVGHELTGEYTYSDADGDGEGNSVYQWYRGSNADGSGKVAIEGATSRTYLITDEDEGQYLFFSVIPEANAGANPGAEGVSPASGQVTMEPVENEVPSADDVTISGTPQVGEELTGEYTYSDADGDAEDNSIYQWYRGNNADGSDKVAINGATTRNYMLTNEDEGQYLFFSVIPVASAGATPGAEGVSSARGPVSATPVENRVPTASGVTISGTAQVGHELIGEYTYTDVDRDAEGNSVYQWYRGSKVDGSDKVGIEGATSKTYTLTNEDEGQYLFFSVIPVASAGATPGAEIVSAERGPITASTVKISVVGPSGTITTSSTPITGTSNAPDGSTVIITVKNPYGQPISLTAIVEDGIWSTSLQNMLNGNYSATATVNVQGTLGTGSGSFIVDSSTWVNLVEPSNGAVVTDSRPMIRGTGEAGDQVSIFIDGTLQGTSTINLDGTWFYSLNQDLVNGQHSVEAVATNTLGRTARATSTFMVDVQATLVQLDLTTSPRAIVANGRSTSQIIATVKDTEGNPIPDVPVDFFTEIGTLSNSSATTGSDGKAVVTITAPLIESIVPIEKLIRVRVNDSEHHLAGDQAVVMSFMPAAIEGVVIGSNGLPVSGAKVEVKEDFNQDGIIDFETSVVTGANGRYNITVPRGNHEYTPIITVPVQLNGTLVGEYTFSQRAQVGQLSGVGGTIVSEKTITGQLFISDDDGQIKEAKAEEYDVVFEGVVANDPSKSVQIYPDGKFEVTGVEKGQSYDVVITPVASDGRRLAGNITRITVTEDGQISVAASLIDPYGQVIDSVTGLPISGVDMKLHWAKDGVDHRAGDLVHLPALQGFPPANNADPQVTDPNGQYAWMVFPDSDYYITASKAGYKEYDSRLEGRDVAAQPNEDSYIEDGVIHVGQTIVAYSFSMEPIERNQPTDSRARRNISANVAPENVVSHLEHRPFLIGYKGGMFRPEKAVTRAEVAGMIARLLRPNRPNFSPPPFKDVDHTFWAAQHIELVRREGIMEGDSKGRFNPNLAITRAEMAAVIARLKKLSLQEPSIYADAAAHWAALEIGSVEKAGYMLGYPENKFRPNSKLTRAEAVTVLNRVLDRGPLMDFEDQLWRDVPKDHWAYREIMEASVSHSSNRDQDGEEKFESEIDHIPTW